MVRVAECSIMWMIQQLLWKTKKVEICSRSWLTIFSAIVPISLLLVLATPTANGSLSEKRFDQGQCSFHDKGSNATVQRHKLSAQCLISARELSGTHPVPDNDLIPRWANLTLFSIGQEFARKNVGYLGIGHFFALIFENFIPDIKDVLLTTGSSNSRERAIKRYTATATQVILWYRNSLNDPEERENLLGSLRTVRRLHLDGAFKAQMRLKGDLDTYIESKRAEILQQLWLQQPPSVVFDETYWLALEKDLLSSKIPDELRHFPAWKNQSHIPISQFAQSLTQFSFAGLPVLFHRELGISHVTRQELEGYVHMWAVLGHAIGIRDEFNICKNDDFEESMRLFRDILNMYFVPAMFQIDWKTRVQLGSYLDAMQQMDQIITPRLITYRFLRDIMKISPMNLFRQMNVLERMYLALVDSLMSNNLEANRFLLNRGGLFFLEVNGYDKFGSHYSNDQRKSKGAFYTRDKLLF